jgi:lysophospholipase
VTGAAPFFADVADAPPGVRAFWLRAADGVRLRAAAWSGGRRGTAVIFPGRTEHIEKYGRVVGRLVERDLAVAAIDWRGQGLSDRLHDNPRLGHVDDFRDFQKDVAALIAHPEFAALPRPLVMFAHSMGGCVGLRTLLERTEFSAAVLSAPMWHLQMKAATRQLTSSIVQVANLVGLGSRQMPGTTREPTVLALAYQGNVLTSDPEHFAWFARQLETHPELGLGGPSVQWTYAALEEMARLYVAPLPKVPVLAFLGSDEAVVSPSVVRSQMGHMEHGRLVMCPGARHEIWMERPEIQRPVWAEIDAFLETVPGLPSRQTASATRGAKHTADGLRSGG